jgi:hypothetical protein
MAFFGVKDNDPHFSKLLRKSSVNKKSLEWKHFFTAMIRLTGHPRLRLRNRYENVRRVKIGTGLYKNDKGGFYEKD